MAAEIVPDRPSFWFHLGPDLKKASDIKIYPSQEFTTKELSIQLIRLMLLLTFDSIFTMLSCSG